MIPRKGTTVTIWENIRNHLKVMGGSPQDEKARPVMEEAFSKTAKFMIANLNLFEQLRKYFKKKGK